MRTYPQLVNDNIDTLNIQRFRILSSPFGKMLFTTMMIDILSNKKGYDYDPSIILMLVKRLYNMGYKIPVGFIYLSLSQIEIDNITGLSDEEIRIYCTNRWATV